MTEIYLITGFLGAGKTTFLSCYGKYLSQQGIRYAVVENEFGTAGVDTAILKEAGIDVSELAGGCICCALKVNFADLLVRLSEHYDRILVEPSGIYSLDEFYEVAKSPMVSARCNIGAVVTVVDPYSLWDMDEESALVLSSQLHSTGKVLFSKTQGMDEADLEAARLRVNEIVRLLSPHAPQIIPFEKDWAAFTNDDFDAIRSARPAFFEHTRHAVNHAMIFGSTTVRPRGPLLEQQLGAIFSEMMNGSCGEILRIKGCVNTELGHCTVNCTPTSMLFEPSAQSVTAVLNVIGKGLNRKRINQLLND